MSFKDFYKPHLYRSVKKHPSVSYRRGKRGRPRQGCNTRVLETRSTLVGIRRRFVCTTHHVRFSTIEPHQKERT